MSDTGIKLSRLIPEVRTEYFEWLCDIVDAQDDDSSYMMLVGELWETEFVAFVKNDISRVDDAKELRYEFLRETNCYDSWYLDGMECRVLEMLIGLARRMDFELMDPDDDTDRTAMYFWELIDNLGLTDCEDYRYIEDDCATKVETAIGRFVWRRYDYDGQGGAFPLEHPPEDQRETELWKQLTYYLNERKENDHGTERDST